MSHAAVAAAIPATYLPRCRYNAPSAAVAWRLQHSACSGSGRLRCPGHGGTAAAQASPSGHSSSSSSGGGSCPSSSDARKASVDELLSGVLYWRAQQMRQGLEPALGREQAHPSASAQPYQTGMPASTSAPHQGQPHHHGINGTTTSSFNGADSPPLSVNGVISSGSSANGGGSVGGDTDDGDPYPGSFFLDASAGTRDVSEALAAYSAAMAQLKSVQVRFCLRLRAQLGQRVKVVGACEQLGNWNLGSAPELQWSQGDTWHATVQLPAGSVTEYKYVLLDASGTRVMAWQDGNNSLLAVRLAEGSVSGGLSIYDDWYAGPGTKLAVGSEAPASRDNRLQTWAGDLFAQLASQRQDLRRTRVELAGAQQEAEEARTQAGQALAKLALKEAEAAAALKEAHVAQMELHRLRAELAAREAERAQAVSSYTQARAMNDVLQTQLTDTTTTLQEAIELLSLRAEEEGERDGTEGEDEAAAEDATAAAAAPAPAPRRRRTSRKAAAAAEGAATGAGALGVLQEAASESGGVAKSAGLVQELGTAAEAAVVAGPSSVKPATARKRGRPSKAALAAAATRDAGAAMEQQDAEPAATAAAAKPGRARKPRSTAAAAAAPVEERVAEESSAADAADSNGAGSDAGERAATIMAAKHAPANEKVAAAVDGEAAGTLLGASHRAGAEAVMKGPRGRQPRRKAAATSTA